jgi:hypothetical protein
MRTSTTPEKSHRQPSPAMILVVPVIVAVIVTLFVWPNARLEPRDLPVGVAGSPAATHALETKLTASNDGFEIHTYSSEAAAQDAIRDREVYGAFVATDRGTPKVLTASAASPTVAQMLDHAATESQPRAQSAAVEDVVDAGPRGGALSSSVFPLIIAGILTGVISGLATTGALRQAGLVVVGSILTGLTITGLIQGWLDVVGGDWVVNAAALTLTVMAIAATVAGLHALFGQVGTIAGSLTMVFLGNPFSAVGTSPDLLPEPVGGFGQLLPPGAGGNLLRSTGYFDGAGSGEHLVVLAAWALGGLVLLTIAGLRDRRLAAAVAPAPVAS